MLAAMHGKLNTCPSDFDSIFLIQKEKYCFKTLTELFSSYLLNAVLSFKKYLNQE